ncbi:MAG: effector binding domain-containing protein [Legionellaceae bacterium]|nr:effector binding domain-containing protein [Legionellaceae bacterium]
MSIQPTIEKVEKFIVTGFNVRTKNCDEFNDKEGKIPSCWEKFYTSKLMANVSVFGVYSDYESDANGFYTYTVGVESKNTQTQFDSVTIQTGNYLVFEGSGAMPITVIETWQKIWDFFEENTEHCRNFISDFEVYRGPDQVAIYIGIYK